MKILESISESKYDKKIIKLPLSAIDTSININPRSQLIKENIENLVNTKFFPEIHIGLLENHLIVIDGYHRIAAAQQLELDTVLAYITKYNSLEEAKMDAFRENVNHGIKLDEYDIAKWIYENYSLALQDNPTVQLKNFIQKCNILERRGRTLYQWYLIHKEILEDDETALNRVGDSEEFYSILVYFKEIPGNISEDFKIKFKEFYYKYCDLNRSELRKAIAWFKEGKDYNEEIIKQRNEMLREEKVVEEMDKKDRVEYNDQFEKIDNEDAIDRQGNADYSERPIEKDVQDTNKEIERLLNEKQEIKQEINETVSKEVTEEKEVVNEEIINTISKNIMTLFMLNAKNKIQLTTKNIEDLKNVKERIEEILKNKKSEELI